MQNDPTPPTTKSHTTDLYNEHSELWVRHEPTVWSDITARPWALDAISWTGKHVLDLGCGEGYVSRQALSRGASALAGVDLSDGMIAAAQLAAGSDTRQHYQVGDASQLDALGLPHGYDVILGVFVANYLSVEQTTRMLDQARRHCTMGGRAIIVAPHPTLPWSGLQEPPVWFDADGAGYDDVNTQMAGTLWKLDGSSVPITQQHKRFSDWLDIVNSSGWRIEQLAELGVPAGAAVRYAVSEQMRNIPLHLGLVLRSRS